MGLMSDLSPSLAKWSSQGSRGSLNDALSQGVGTSPSIVSRGVTETPEQVNSFWDEAANRTGGWWRLVQNTPDANGMTNGAAQYEWVPGEPPAGYVNPFGGSGSNTTSNGFQISPFTEGAVRMNPSELSPLGNAAGSSGGLFNNIGTADILSALRLMGLGSGSSTDSGSTGSGRRLIYR